MDRLGGLLADHVNAKKSHVVLLEQEFQKPSAVADDLAPSIVRVAGLSDHVGSPLLLERFFRFSRHGTFRNREYAVGQNMGDAGFVFQIKRMNHRHSGLLHRCGGQRRKTDDITDSVDVGNLCLIVFVHLDLTAPVDCDTHLIQIQCLSIARPAGCNQNDLCTQPGAGIQF